MQFQRGNIKLFLRGDPTLKAYWSFEQLTTDYSGNNYHLTDETGNGGTTPTQQRGLLPIPGFSASFNGSNQCFKNTSLTNYGRSLTLIAWIQPTSVPTAQKWIVGQSGATQLCILSTGKVVCYNYLSGTWKSIEDPNIVEINRPSCYISTDNGTTMKLYKNGLLIAAGDKSGTYNNNNAATLIAGYYQAGVGFQQMYNGRIDEVAIIFRPLSAQEISQYYKWATGVTKRKYAFEPIQLPQPNFFPFF